MNKKVPVGLYPRDISNDWREKKCTYCKKDIKRQYYKYCQVNENVTRGKLLPIHISEITHKVFTIKRRFKFIGPQRIGTYWEVGCSI